MFYGWKPYVTAAERRRRAEREIARLRKEGHPVAPIVVRGRAIARTFWGKAWGENLERYSDYANRLPRGRTYVRNGSVLDLQIAPGRIDALVSGTSLYRVTVQVAPVSKPRWTAICRDCAGTIDSLVELLQGHLAKGVMERICRPGTGLFPAPSEIRLACNCPDWAIMCKHVAATLYGTGARLDEHPELLFRLRQVKEEDLIVHAGRARPLTRKTPAADRILAPEGLSEIFGLDLADAEPAPARRKTPAKPTAPRPGPAKQAKSRKKATVTARALTSVGVKVVRKKKAAAGSTAGLTRKKTTVRKDAIKPGAKKGPPRKAR